MKGLCAYACIQRNPHTNEAQTMSLVQESGNAKVIAVHMNAYDHCHTTRSSLKQKAEESNIENDKLIIPEDGGRVFFKIHMNDYKKTRMKKFHLFLNA